MVLTKFIINTSFQTNYLDIYGTKKIDYKNLLSYSLILSNNKIYYIQIFHRIFLITQISKNKNFSIILNLKQTKRVYNIIFKHQEYIQYS